jgi:hypothetical protein
MKNFGGEMKTKYIAALIASALITVSNIDPNLFVGVYANATLLYGAGNVKRRYANREMGR